MHKVLVIVGQTATGKTALAVKLAKKFKGEVISADSRQVYKGLNIGTDKIKKKDMRGIPHHLLNVANPKKRFTASEFKDLAGQKIKEIIKRGKIPIIAGGTGFYIDAVTKNIVFPVTRPNVSLRRKLAFASDRGLMLKLKKLDKKRAESIDPRNRARLMRAIEIALSEGKVPEIKLDSPVYDFIKIGVVLPKEKLRKNIEKRAKKMFEAGLLREIKNLKKKGITDSRLKEFGFEYYKPTLESVIAGTWKYARRQKTWFKKDKEIKWFSPSDVSKIEKFLAKKIR